MRWMFFWSFVVSLFTALVINCTTIDGVTEDLAYSVKGYTIMMCLIIGFLWALYEQE